MTPELIELSSMEEYRKYYEREYCHSPIYTFDGIPIYFSKSRFSHAFFESSDRRNSNDTFSFTRAKRISWIKTMLQSKTAILYQGWDKRKRKYDPTGRVVFEYEQFVVVIRLSLKKDGSLKGNFITCYQANNSIEKIKKSPTWNKEKCLEVLNKQKSR